MVNYSNISIYKIYCKDPSIIYFYIGSTTNIIVKRSIHKRNLVSRPNDFLSTMINNNGGWDNWKMDIIEKYDCNTKCESIAREQYWYNLLNSAHPQNINNNASDTQQILSPNDCIYCKKHFSRKDNLKRHSQICKSKQLIEEQKANNQFVLANTTSNILTNPTTIPASHTPNVLANSNSMNNNSNNTNNTIINNITNPVTIIPLGQENLVEFFSDEEQVRILKKMFSCFIYLIEYVHFSGKFPQFANMRITNLRSNTAYLYDEGDKKFVAHDQNEVIAEVISERLTDISNFFENVKDKLNEKEVNKITALINELEEQRLKYTEYQRKLKFMLYNKRHMVNDQNN